MFKIFSKRLKEVRIENNLSQAQLAELCNVKQSCVSKWERGTTSPDAETIYVLCTALHTSADYLLGIEEY